MYSTTVISSGKTSRGITIRDMNYVYVDRGGKTINASIYYGVEEVAGVASNTLISARSPYTHSSSYAVQNVYYGGSTIDTRIVGSGAGMYVDGGIASKTTINSGGYQGVLHGTAYETTVNSGFLEVSFGGTAVNARVASNSKTAITLYNGGRLEYSSNVTMGGTLEIVGVGNTINRLNTNTNSNIKFVLPGPKNKSDYGLTLSRDSKNNGIYSVVVSKRQKAGTYRLARHLSNANDTKYTIYMKSSASEPTQVGSATVNRNLSRNGMTYTLNSKSNSITLTVAIKAGLMRKGTTRNDTLNGGNDSDIFYGGKGNDTINGVNGRDVAIYDATAWGKDVIRKTSGTMTILFNGLEKRDILFKKSNGNMVITNRKDKSQTITVNSWNDSTHNVAYTDSINSFRSYLNQTNPTSSTINNVRKSTWQKAGLTAS